tara:strand:- start:1314 stop:1469 length:156 start_codon:yes stop_codon:yes gene_type:complete
MYSLDSPYYDREFESMNDLIDDVTVSGADPNCEITLDGKGTGEMAIDLMEF